MPKVMHFRAQLAMLFALLLSQSVLADKWLTNEVFRQNVDTARAEVDAIAGAGRDGFVDGVARAIAQAQPNADRVAAIIYFATRKYPSMVTDIVGASVEGAPDQAASIVYVASMVVPAAAPQIIGAALTAAPDRALTAVHAAVTAAPGQTLGIVEVAVQTVPRKAGTITYAAAFANPALSQQVVETAKANAPEEMYAAIDEALLDSSRDNSEKGQYVFKDFYKRYDFDEYLRQQGEEPPKVAEGEKEPDNDRFNDKLGEDAYFQEGTFENHTYGNGAPPSGSGNGSSSAASPS